MSKKTFKTKKRISLYQKKKSRKKYKIIKKVSVISLITVFMFNLILIGMAFSGFNYFKDRLEASDKPEEIFTALEYSTIIYDRNGKELFVLRSDVSNRLETKPEEITPRIKAVFMAAEDGNFYRHEGYDLEAIFRCGTNHITESGRKCGASTITQQLVKIMTQNTEPSVERKVNEIFSASELENIYSKDEILHRYLNITPYGSNITGLKTASKFYFGQEDLSKLTLKQLVTLSAIVNDPVNLSPTLSSNKSETLERLELRENYVLSQLELKLNTINEQLLNNGENNDEFIDIEEINSAKKEKVKFIKPVIRDIKAGHFVNYAVNELQKKSYIDGKPFTLENLQNGGYKIYTTIDYNLQQIAERYVKQAGEEYKKWNVYNAAVMTADPATGQVLTMAGSKDFYGKSEACDAAGENCKYDPEVNVLLTEQSPGSTAKPLGFMIAYEKSKLFPGSFLPDIPIEFGGYKPKNWDSKFTGPFHTAREMLRQSRNIPALLVVDSIGYDTYIEYARKFGYTTYKDVNNYGASIILGGGDIYPVEHVQAYGVFANQGNRVDLNPILKIEDKDGNVIYEANPTPVKVADPGATFLLNQTLLGLETGIRNETINWDNREVAGKTGTTEDNRDALLLMYSPDFVTLGWAGNNNNEQLNTLYGWPGFIVAPWLRGYMNEIGQTKYFNAKTPFPKPDNVYYGGGDCYSGQCLGIRPDWLISGREPARGDMYLNAAGGRSFRMLNPALQGYLNNYFARAKAAESPNE